MSDPSPYNGILGRPWLIKLDAVTSVKYQKIRFRIPGGGVGEIKSDQAASRRCTVQMLKESSKKTFTPVEVTEDPKKMTKLPNSNYSRRIEKAALKQTRQAGNPKKTLKKSFSIRSSQKRPLGLALA